MKDFRPEEVANPIIDRVAGDGGRNQQADREPDVQMRTLARSQHAESEQQRVARQNGGDDQARLAKDHDEHQQVQPRAETRRDRVEVLVEVQEEVDRLPDQVHLISLAGSAGRQLKHEIRMTKEARSPKYDSFPSGLDHSDIPWSFGLRHSRASFLGTPPI